MKFTCDFDKFRNAFMLAYLCADRNALNETLRSVKVTAEDGKLTLSANCVSNGLRITLDRATIFDKGEILLPTEVVRRALACNSNFTTFDLQTHGSNVSFLNGQYHGVPTRDTQDFTDMPFPEFAAYHVVKGSELRRLIKNTSFATETANSKYTLNGILLEFGDKELTAVSTDGRRMAVCSAVSEKVVGNVATDNYAGDVIIVPSNGLPIIYKVVEVTREDTYIITVKDGKLILRSENLDLAIQLLRGRYPKWRNVVPECNDWQYSVLDTKEFIDSIARVSAVNISKGGEPKFKCNFDGDALTLESHSETGGFAEVQMLTREFEGEPISVNLNSAYASDFLKHANDAVTVFIKDGDGSPVVFTTGDNYKYILMPMS